jgi:L-lysine exporter family protein LysE/ArgO
MISVMPSWVAPFGVGFALSFSLILAIGAQNAFVLRQGLMRQHIGALVLFCALSDAVLIIAGVAGLAPLLAQWLISVERWLFAGAAGWLAIYGLMRGYAAWRGAAAIEMGAGKDNGLAATLAMAAVLTFGNPHVYLDTVVLIGTVSLQFENAVKIAFALGAVSASFVFFTSLGYGAAALSGVMQRPYAWRLMDVTVALVMFALAYGLARAGGWL